jgi:hypothetical protein
MQGPSLLIRRDSPVVGDSVVEQVAKPDLPGPCSPRFRPNGHRTPSYQTPVRDGPKRGRLLSFYRRLKPIPCRKTVRSQPSLVPLMPKGPDSRTGERVVLSPHCDPIGPLTQPLPSENHRYVRGRADTRLASHCQDQLLRNSFSIAHIPKTKSRPSVALRFGSAAKLLVLLW